MENQVMEKPDHRLQLQTFSKRLEILQSVKNEDALRYASILKIIRYVENKKQLKLSEDQRESLAISLNDLPETLDQILNRAEIVIRNTDYSRIPFDVWINAKKVYTEEEVKILFAKEIELLKKRIQEAKLKNVNETIVNEELLQNEHAIYAQRLEDIRERLRISLKNRIKKAERFIKTAPEEIKIELLKHLTEKKLLSSEDAHWMKIIHYFTPHILPETEKLMKGTSYEIL